MTTAKEIDYVLTHITVEAYMAGLDDGMPIHFTPGNKVQGNSPRIAKNDGTVPDYVPTLNLKDSNATVMAKLEATVDVFFAIRKAREKKA